MTEPIVLPPGGGRSYALGRMHARFMADGTETADRYSISEWLLEPGTPGPGAHSHAENDDIFYVLEGTAAFLLGDRWVDMAAGSFVRAPAGVVHDYQNRTDRPVRLLNLYIPGGFEQHMPAIVQWFAENR